MPTTWRTLYLTKRTVMPDGNGYSLVDPPSTLPELLARTARVTGPGGMTLILGNDAHVALGMPKRAPRREVTELPALDAARAVGWNIKQLDPWMTFWRAGSPSIHVGVRPWLNPGNFVFHDPEPAIEQLRLREFHKMVGVAYHGKHAGLAGIDLVRDQHRGRAPVWMPDNWSKVEPAALTGETAIADWRTGLPDHGKPFEHAYDARMQFLAAAGNAKIAVKGLTWAHPNEVPLDSPSSVLPGLYLVTVPWWEHAARIPHPLGERRQPGDQVWISGATLELVIELAHREQVIAMPEVHEAYVAVGGQMLKGWAEQIRDAEVAARSYGDEVIHTAVKEVYKAGIGLLARKGQARVYRPDWQQTVVGLARANLWRKIWKEGKTTGRWPVQIHRGDTVWYAGADHEPDWPATFKQGSGLGCFQHKDTRTVTE